MKRSAARPSQTLRATSQTMSSVTARAGEPPNKQ